MVFVYKSLAQGQLPNAKGTIYTVPASTTAYIKSLKVVNTDSSARTVNIYVKRSGGTSRRIWPSAMSLAAGYVAEDEDIGGLSTGDIIEGDASAATVVDYTILGAER